MSDFWSRRREAVAQEDAALQAAELAEAEAARETELAERSDEDLLAEHNLPVPEELDSSEAVRAFMQSDLPQRLKTRALRRLWRLNPALANLDGLIDYGEDFTDQATVVEDLQTAYQIGKGMLSHIEALAAQEAQHDAPEEHPEDNGGQDAEQQDQEQQDPEQAAQIDDTESPTVLVSASQAELATRVEATAEPEALPAMPSRRRMRFQFEDEA